MHTPPFSLPGNCFKESETSVWHPDPCFGKEKRVLSFIYTAPMFIVYYDNWAYSLAESICCADAAKEMYFGFLNTCFFALMHLYFLLGMHE